MRAGLDISLKQKNWRGSSSGSELDLALGEVATAISNARKSIAYGKRCCRNRRIGCVSVNGDDPWLSMIGLLATHADALHQAGRRAEAQTQFQRAEELQTKHHYYPLLHSTNGFKYCDLLLSRIEWAAWEPVLNARRGPWIPIPSYLCQSVLERATTTLEWVEAVPSDILSNALEHLTLARAVLYAAMLKIRDKRGPTGEHAVVRSDALRLRMFTSPPEISQHLEASVNLFRSSARYDYVPCALVTRAWLFFLGRDTKGALADLDEAWDLAARGPMRLHMADIHLYRVRLFFREKYYPWKSPEDDLAAAERLINECHYHRRDGELADAKHAILGS